MDKIYLIGRIWDPDKTFKETYEKFATWEYKLKELGYDIVNPMKIISEHSGQEQSRIERAKGLLEGNAIMLLDDWGKSDWAKKEFEIAVWLKYRIYTYTDYNHLINLANTLKAATPESSQ